MEKKAQPMSEPTEPGAAPGPGVPDQRKPLTPAAERALAEAAARRAEATSVSRAPEIDGPKGPEPTRYGDWEKGGIASDF